MPLTTVPLAGHAPDLDPETPGVFSYCYGMEPTSRGWKLVRSIGAIGSVTIGGAGLTVRAGFEATITSGAKIDYVAITVGSALKDKLYRVDSGTSPVLTDTSRAAFYTQNSAWSFCQYGNYTLATNYSDVVQIRDASGSSAFADSAATGIPKAKMCVTWGPPTSPRVMLLSYNDGTAYLDGWWSSHQGGPTADWTPDIATGAANGRLLGSNPLTCGVAYGDDIIAFSWSTMWHGKFVGPPTVVEWRKVSDKVGCVGYRGATTLNGLLYFVGAQGLWVYDGSSLTRMAVPIQQAIINNIGEDGSNYAEWASFTIQGDQAQQRLRIQDLQGSDLCFYSINVLNNRVGRIPMVYGSGASEIDLQFPMSGNKYCADDGNYAGVLYVIEENRSVPYTAGSSDNFGFAPAYLGSNKQDTLLRGVIPRFVVKPSTYIMTDYYGPTFSEITSTATAVTVSATPWRANLTKTARWHAPRMIFTSAGSAATDVEVMDVMLDVEQAGRS